MYIFAYVILYTIYYILVCYNILYNIILFILLYNLKLYYIVLQLYYIILYYVILYYVLNYIILYYTILYYVILYYIVFSVILNFIIRCMHSLYNQAMKYWYFVTSMVCLYIYTHTLQFEPIRLQVNTLLMGIQNDVTNTTDILPTSNYWYNTGYWYHATMRMGWNFNFYMRSGCFNCYPFREFWPHSSRGILLVSAK